MPWQGSGTSEEEGRKEEGKKGAYFLRWWEEQALLPSHISDRKLRRGKKNNKDGRRGRQV